MKRYFLVAVGLLFTLWSCNKADNTSAEGGYTTEVEATSNDSKQADEPTETENLAIERKLIKNAHLTFETKSLTETHQKIVAAIAKSGGYIASDSEEKGYEQVLNRLEIRLPADKFDAFLAEISIGVDHFDTRTISAQDVTAEFFDLETRLNTKKELEKRFLELLAKAKTVAEIIEIEKEIAALRSDIEVMEGSMRLMKNQIAFSTVWVEFYVKQIEESSSYSWRFSRGFVDGWNNFLGFFVGLTYIWPFILIAIVGFVFLRRRWRKRKS